MSGSATRCSGWGCHVAGKAPHDPPRGVYGRKQMGYGVYVTDDVKQQVSDVSSARVPAFTRISPTARDTVMKFAEEEDRTYAGMLRVLLQEAVAARLNTSKRRGASAGRAA